MTNPGGAADVGSTRGWDHVTRALDRHHRWALAAFIVLYFVVTAIRAHGTPFWHDEIYTLLLSRLPTVHDVWRAARSGADITPPLNLFLTRAAESLAGSNPVASRLPAMAGFAVMSVVVFYIVRAHSTVVLASAAVLVPWYTRAYRYSYEARGYGVMLGLFALLALSWLESARGQRRQFWLPVFAIATAATLWNHYFGCLTFAPIACGEAYRWIRRGAPDWGMGGAAAAGLLLCAPLVPLARQAAGEGATYWRHAAWTDVGTTYSFLFRELWSMSPWMLALLGAIVVIGAVRGGWTAPPSIASGHETVAGLVALTIPALAVAVGRLSGGFAPRYALSAVVGGAVVLPLALWWISRRSPLLEVALLAILAVGVVQPSIDVLEHPSTLPDPLAERRLLVERLHDAPPVVVGGAVQFLQLWYYAPPELQRRLWYVADPARSLQYLGSDTADRGYVALARLLPIGIKTYAQLLDQRSFVLYDDRTGWLGPQLRDAGAVIAVDARELGTQILRVTLPDRR